MFLRQFLHTEPIAASYLLGCGGKAAGAVVDPVRDVAAYLAAAEATGLRVRYVADTHLHADHVSAGLALAEAAGAEYVLFNGADASILSTIGFERRNNKAFRIGAEDEFIRVMLADIPPAPPQAAQVRAANSGLVVAA